MQQHRQFAASGLVSLLIVILMLAYPFAVYQYIQEVSPAWFAGILLVVFSIRFLFVTNTKQINDWLMYAVILTFCLIVMIFDSEALLKFYPVLMNVGMGLLFIVSLTGEQSLIEKFAKAGGKTPPLQAQGYLRSLSMLWGVLLILNGAVSAYTAWYTSLSFWALYNGLIAYLLIAGFAISEWCYRGYYKKKHNIIDD